MGKRKYGFTLGVNLNALDLPGEQLLTIWRSSGISQSQLATRLGVPFKTLHSKINNAAQREIRDAGRQVLKPSPYPVYDKPLEMEGDALIIPDPEFPFHHAPFMNRVLDLADTWGITQCIIAGDALHFNSLSKWEPEWKAQPKNGLTEAQEERLLAFASKVQARYRDDFIQAIVEDDRDGAGDDVGSEVTEAKKCMVRLSEQFTQVDYVIGNHDGRFLSALHSPLFADKLLDFIGLNDPKWRIAPFYYSVLYSGGQCWRIEHPKGSARSTASSLASKYLCNIAMGHSHRWSMEFDRSGNFYAIHMGCCVDENRLPYASQRSHSGDAHKLGAMIIVDGRPYLLNEHTDWERYKRMM